MEASKENFKISESTNTLLHYVSMWGGVSMYIQKLAKEMYTNECMDLKSIMEAVNEIDYLFTSSLGAKILDNIKTSGGAKL